MLDMLETETRLTSRVGKLPDTYSFSIQKEDGIIEGWHGDGNFARTAIMYCLWKTQGTTLNPWREDVVFGAAVKGDALYIALKSEKDWEGKLKFDISRYK